jgi:hypothetical protein
MRFCPRILSADKIDDYLPLERMQLRMTSSSGFLSTIQKNPWQITKLSFFTGTVKLVHQPHAALNL